MLMLMLMLVLVLMLFRDEERMIRDSWGERGREKEIEVHDACGTIFVTRARTYSYV